MPTIIAEQLASLVLQCGTADEMRERISTALATARSSGYGAEVGEIYRLLCENLARRLQNSNDGERARVQLAHDVACEMSDAAGY